MGMSIGNEPNCAKCSFNDSEFLLIVSFISSLEEGGLISIYDALLLSCDPIRTLLYGFGNNL